MGRDYELMLANERTRSILESHNGLGLSPDAQTAFETLIFRSTKTPIPQRRYDKLIRVLSGEIGSKIAVVQLVFDIRPLVKKMQSFIE